MVKIRAEIKEIEKKESTEMINKMKSCFCKKQKIGKPIVKLRKMERKHNSLSSLQMPRTLKG